MFLWINLTSSTSPIYSCQSMSFCSYVRFSLKDIPSSSAPSMESSRYSTDDNSKSSGKLSATTLKFAPDISSKRYPTIGNGWSPKSNSSASAGTIISISSNCTLACSLSEASSSLLLFSLSLLLLLFTSLSLLSSLLLSLLVSLLLFSLTSTLLLLSLLSLLLSSLLHPTKTSIIDKSTVKNIFLCKEILLFYKLIKSYV